MKDYSTLFNFEPDVAEEQDYTHLFNFEPEAEEVEEGLAGSIFNFEPDSQEVKELSGLTVDTEEPFEFEPQQEPEIPPEGEDYDLEGIGLDVGDYGAEALKQGAGGAAESYLSIGTGLSTMFAAGLGVVQALPAIGPEKAAEGFQKAMEAYTYQPRTKGGEQQLRAMTVPFELWDSFSKDVADRVYEEADVDAAVMTLEGVGLDAGDYNKEALAAITYSVLKNLPLIVPFTYKKVMTNLQKNKVWNKLNSTEQSLVLTNLDKSFKEGKISAGRAARRSAATRAELMKERATGEVQPGFEQKPQTAPTQPAIRPAAQKPVPKTKVGKEVATAIEGERTKSPLAGLTAKEAELAIEELTFEPETEAIELSGPEITEKQPWQMTRKDYYYQQTKDYLNLPVKGGQGYAKFPRTHYIRFGEPPVDESGNRIPSKNWLINKNEKGLSVYPAIYDPKTGKYLLGEETGDMALYAGDLGSTRKAYIIEGDIVQYNGGDGEPLVDQNKIKSIKEINADDIADPIDIWRSVTGKEFEDIEIPDIETLPGRIDSFEHPSVKHQKVIEEAIARGETIPEEVLKDYTELTTKPTQEPIPEPESVNTEAIDKKLRDRELLESAKEHIRGSDPFYGLIVDARKHGLNLDTLKSDYPNDYKIIIKKYPGVFKYGAEAMPDEFAMDNGYETFDEFVLDLIEKPKFKDAVDKQVKELQAMDEGFEHINDLTARGFDPVVTVNGEPKEVSISFLNDGDVVATGDVRLAEGDYTIETTGKGANLIDKDGNKTHFGYDDKIKIDGIKGKYYEQNKEKGFELYAGVPLNQLGKAKAALEKLYDDHIGSPLWNFLSDTLPKRAGDKSAVIDKINKGLILDYKKDPDFIALRDATNFKVAQYQEKAKELADSLAKFPRAEQIRISQIISGSITTTPKRYEKALEAAKEFQRLEKELQDLGILGPDNRFRQLTRKELSAKFREIEEIDAQVKDLHESLKPIIKIRQLSRKVATNVMESVLNEDATPYEGDIETRINRAVELNENRVKDALIARGFAEGEADQMIRRIKESVVASPEVRTGNATQIKTTVQQIITKTVKEGLEITKTYNRRAMARARGSIVKDINKLNKKRADTLKRISTHYKMSGKQYLRRAYESIENEKGFIDNIIQYLKGPRLKRGYSKRRKDLTYEQRQQLGEIKEAPYPVYKGLSQEYFDIEMMKYFTKISENPEWAISKKDWVDIQNGADTAAIDKYSTFKPLPESDKLGPLSGALVDQYIWDDLNQAVKIRSDFVKAWDKALSLWKTGKVVYNPAAQVRNLMSNSILADMGGLPHYRMDIYAEAAHNLMNKGAYWHEAKSTPLLGDEWASAEAYKFYNELASTPDGSIYSKLADSMKWLADKPTQSYQANEQFFKLAVFINERKKGASIEEAAAHAEKWIFNYQKIPPVIRETKRWYAPFVTWTYKVLPRMAETAVRKPWKYGKYLLYMLAVEEIARRYMGDSKEEVELEKKALPDYMRNPVLPGQTSHLRIPITDKYGRSKYIDLSYILPWGDVTEQWGQSRLYGRALLPSNPLFVIGAELATNEVMFSGQELTLDSDDWFEYSTKIGTEIWRQAVPSLFGSYSSNKLISAWKGDLDWLGRERSLPEAIFDTMLGIKIRSIDYNVELGNRMREYDKQIEEVRDEFENQYLEITRTATPRPEKDALKIQKLQEKTQKKLNSLFEKITDLTTLD